MHHNIADAVRRWYYEAPDGLTDEEIAARLGVSRRMVHNYRKSARKPPALAVGMKRRLLN